MFSRLAVVITNRMEKDDIISSEDRDIYLFGIWQGLYMLFGLFTMILIGLLLGATLHVLIFASAYMPLRCFAGGYHAKTQLRCYIASIAISVFVSVMFLEISLSQSIKIMSLLIFGVLIIALSPVGNANKPLDCLEKKGVQKKNCSNMYSRNFYFLDLYSSRHSSYHCWYILGFDNSIDFANSRKANW